MQLPPISADSQPTELIRTDELTSIISVLSVLSFSTMYAYKNPRTFPQIHALKTPNNIMLIQLSLTLSTNLQLPLPNLCTNSLLEIRQSAYRKYHSTETAVVSVLEGLLTKSVQKLVSVLALLDLSAAFDTFDHTILLRPLERTFGISGVALSWFESYLSDRTHSVVVDGLMSRPIPLVFGVLQGSVLGLVLFTLYSQPLSDVIACHSCDYHKYADDIEISDSVPPSDFTSA